MFPVINLGSLLTYNLFLLGGILVGWFVFLTDEYHSIITGRSKERTWIFLKTTLTYMIIVIFCIQGANYFHYFFDNLPEKIKNSLTIKDILLTPPIGTSKVLYGTIFLTCSPDLSFNISSAFFLKPSRLTL